MMEKKYSQQSPHERKQSDPFIAPRNKDLKDQKQEERKKFGQQIQEERWRGDHLLNELKEKEALLRRIMESRSWRYTAWMRKTEHFLKTFWKKPLYHNKPSVIQGTHEASDIAVVIPCHNYSRYLPIAIESILNQTLKPREILVIDDSSTDETPEVARSYTQCGVKCLRCEYGNPAETRNEGAGNTTAPFLVFLDADDALAPDYLEKCRKGFSDTSIAIVYANMQFRGNEKHFFEAPEFNMKLLLQDNYISSHAMIRRQAFDLVGGFRHFKHSHEDWDLYRRILQYPWTAKKAETTVYYRVHENSRSSSHREGKLPYWEGACLLETPITIFTPFAGRKETFELYLAALKQLEFKPELVRLHWFDTSGNEKFGQMLRNTMATLPFGRTTYSYAPLPTLWNHTPQSLIKHRMDNQNKAEYYYEMAVSYAYNNLITTCDTEFALVLEDDIIPSPNTLISLLKTVQPTTVAVVTAYECHFHGCQMVWKRDSQQRIRHFSKRQQGIEVVGGGGFGCSLLRMNALRDMPIYTRVLDDPPEWYDYVTFTHMQQHGEVLCNWDIDVKHLQTKRPSQRTIEIPLLPEHEEQHKQRMAITRI